MTGRIRSAFAALLAAFFALLPAASEPLRPSPDRWPVFRGDSGLSGVAPARLPSRLRIRWSFKTEDQVSSSPVAGDGRVFIGSSDGKLYCLDLATGRKVWGRDFETSVVAPPLFDGDAVYVGTLGGTVHRLDAASGAQRWSFATGGDVAGSVNIYRSEGSRKAEILVGSYDGHLYALDSGTGAKLWSFPTRSFINGTPSISGNMVVFGGCDAQLHVISAIDGREVYAVDTGAYIPGSAASVDGKAFVGNYADRLLCVNLRTGAIDWDYNSDPPGAGFFSSPAVSGNAVVIGGRDGMVRCLDPRDGSLKWTYEAGAEVDSAPVIAGDEVIFGTSGGRLTIVSLANGKERWSFEVGDAITGAPAVVGGLVLIGCNDGSIYAFGE